MPSSPAKAGTLDNASMPFASAVRRTVSEQGAEPAPPPAPPLRQWVPACCEQPLLLLLLLMGFMQAACAYG